MRKTAGFIPPTPAMYLQNPRPAAHTAKIAAKFACDCSPPYQRKPVLPTFAPMNYLSVENVSKSYGERVLFADVSFGLDKGSKMALVARNGTGKTTLLRMLANQESPDTGNVTFRKGIKVGFLMQDPEMDAEASILETILSGTHPTVQAVRQYEEALENPSDQEALNKAMEQMHQLNAWDFEARVREVLGKLAVDMPMRKTGSLSGGQRKRVAMARLLIHEPDLMILDEPTNHLDLEMIEWLEEYLVRFTGAVFMVTHDRYFLDRVCDEIVEMDEQRIYKHRGNYQTYLENHASRKETQATNIEKAQNLYRKELDWMRRQPKARTTKSKARIDSFGDIKKVAKTRIDDRKVELEINMHRLGSKILELHNVGKSFDGKQLLHKFDYKFQRKERVGIIGRNGTGKSTLLNLITGALQPDAGKIVVGETVVFGYYHQDGIKLSEEKRVIEVVKDIAEYIPLTKGRKLWAGELCERFMFDRKQQYDFVSKLSGGERRRLYLLTILMKNPNFLILDEPTNDLDILTLNVLEEFLLDFPGCLLVVTHDRYFMDKLVDHVFVLEGNGQSRDFPGNYTQYRSWKQQQKRSDAAQPQKAASEGPASSGGQRPAPSGVQGPAPSAVEGRPDKKDKPKTRLSYNEKREFEQLEKDLPELEKRKEALTEFMNSGTTDHEELLAKGKELEALIDELEEKEMRWLELSEFAD